MKLKTEKQIRKYFEKWGRFKPNRINHPYSIITSDGVELISDDTRDLYLQLEKHEMNIK